MGKSPRSLLQTTDNGTCLRKLTTKSHPTFTHPQHSPQVCQSQEVHLSNFRARGITAKNTACSIQTAKPYPGGTDVSKQAVASRRHRRLSPAGSTSSSFTETRVFIITAFVCTRRRLKASSSFTEMHVIRAAFVCIRRRLKAWFGTFERVHQSD